jgi:hypothetical protein
MSAIDLFEWTFSPSNYFGERVVVKQDNYEMTIADGRVTARINSTFYDDNPSIRNRMEQSLIGRFQGIQLVSHRTYELQKTSHTRIHDDGNVEVTVERHLTVLALPRVEIHTKVTDQDGNIISDSKRDQVQQMLTISELAAKHRGKNSWAGAMLTSFENAVRHPQSELVHLYEIPDALSTCFVGKHPAIKALGIKESDWSRLSRICNEEPLRQGRHRGKMVQRPLRDVTEAELSEARSIAKSFVIAYLKYLDETTNRRIG